MLVYQRVDETIFFNHQNGFDGGTCGSVQFWCFPTCFQHVLRLSIGHFHLAPATCGHLSEDISDGANWEVSRYSNDWRFMYSMYFIGGSEISHVKSQAR